MGFKPSKSTLGKYLKKLSWWKIKSKYCQFVHTKNRIERVIYANLCQARNLQHHDSIFIDETTRQGSRNSTLQWFQTFQIKQEEALSQNIFMNPLCKLSVEFLDLAKLNSFNLKVISTLLDFRIYAINFCKPLSPAHIRMATTCIWLMLLRTLVLVLKFFYVIGRSIIGKLQHSPDMNPIEHIWNDMKILNIYRG